MHTFPTSGPTRLVVYNPIGLVDVRAVATEETSIDLLPRGDDADSLLDETSVTSTDVGGVSVVTVTFPHPKSFLRRRGGVDLQATVPEHCDVVVATQGAERSLLMLARGESGDVRLHGTVGDVDVSLPSGDVTAQVVAGALKFQTASGDLNVDSVAGPVKVRSVSGDVQLGATGDDVSITLVSGDVDVASAAREVDVTSVSGDLTIGDAQHGATAKSTSGDVTIRRAWRGTIRCTTVSGDVTVGVATGRGVSVEARSMSGELRSEIDLDDNRGDPGAGSGGGDVVRITASSVSGDVEIVRASAPANA